MRRVSASPRRRIAVVAVGLVVMLGAAVASSAASGAQEADPLDDPLNDPFTEEGFDRFLDRLEPDHVLIHYQLIDVDALTNFATFRLTPRPQGELGTSLTTTWLLRDIDLRMVVDSAQGIDPDSGRTDFVYAGLRRDAEDAEPLEDPAGPGEAEDLDGLAYGVIDVEVDIDLDLLDELGRRGLTFYPFDVYPYRLPVILQQRPASGTPDNPARSVRPVGEDGSLPDLVPGGQDWQPLPGYLFPFGAVVEGFADEPLPATFSGAMATVDDLLADAEAGTPGTVVRVERSLGTKVLTAVIAFVYTTSFISVTTVGVRIGRGRMVPDDVKLSWFAALMFAQVAIRTLLPDTPPIGIVFDFVFFFPSIVAAVVVTLLHVLVWSRRHPDLQRSDDGGPTPPLSAYRSSV